MTLDLSAAPESLHGDLRRYFEAEWRGGDAQVLACDVALALLRLGHRRAAQKILGIEIKVCPPAVPPWRPLPVARAKRGPRVTRVGSPPLTKHTLARFKRIRVGMTPDQLAAKGISKRDVRVWSARGYLEVGP